MVSHCEPLSWAEREGGGSDKPSFRMAQGQKGSESKDSHPPNLGDLLLEAPQGILIGLPLVVSLKGAGADLLRNWGRTTELTNLPLEL